MILDQAGGRADRRDDQKPGNVIANDQFAGPTDLEMTSAFGPWRTRAVRYTCLLLAQSGHAPVHRKCPLVGVKRT